MGDLIEFKTWPKHQRIFHEVTSGGITFWLKSRRSVIVGLAVKPNEDCFYEFIIQPGKCSLKSGREDCSAIDVDDILSGYEFRKFWILWKNNTIDFGSGTTLFLRWQCKFTIENLIKYVTFCSNKDSGMADWKFYQPPVAITENLPIKRLQGGELRWVHYKCAFTLPDEALIGGFENEFLYIIRVAYRGSLTPGKLVPSIGLGFIAWGSECFNCGIVEILCGYNCTWVQSKDNVIPAGAVEGGFSEVNRETLYVGRVHHQGHLIVGKVQPSHRCCYFAYLNKTNADRIFEVLVSLNTRTTEPVTDNGDEEDLIDDNIHLWLNDDE